MAGKLYTSYKGFPSFFSGKIMGPEEIEEGMLVVAGVPIDQGIVTARPGARYGAERHPGGVDAAPGGVRGFGGEHSAGRGIGDLEEAGSRRRR